MAEESLPPISQSYIDRAAQLLRAGRTSEAAAIVDMVRVSHPDHIRVWRILNDLYLSESYVGDGPATAVAFFKSKLPANPTPETLDPFCLLARAERYAGNPARALEITDQILKINPDWLEARYEYGLAYYPFITPRLDTQWQSVSVCLPSRFTRHPVEGWYWLERAANSIRGQTIAGKMPLQICVGIDHGTVVPDVFANQSDMIFANVAADAPKNQAAAVNAAAAAATGDIIAFLEDDDIYAPERLETALDLLHKYDFVGGTQRVLTPSGASTQIHDYANPTTWVMRHEFWKRVGPMDTSFRCHLDAEWLGRLNASGGLRVHQVDNEAPREWHALASTRLFYLYFYSAIKRPGNGVYFTGLDHPICGKTAHDESMTDTINANPALKQLSHDEHVRMETMYHGRPF